MADRSFWRDVAVRVVASLVVAGVLAVLSWLLGWWPAIRHALGVAAHGVWVTILFTAPVPLSAIAALLLAIIIAMRALGRARQRIAFLEAAALRQPPTLDELLTISQQQFHPDEIQEQILRLLASLDGESLPYNMISDKLNVGALIVDKALSGLTVQGLIWRNKVTYGGSPAVGLSEKGRDYVIKAGFAPSRPRRRY